MKPPDNYRDRQTDRQYGQGGIRKKDKVNFVAILACLTLCKNVFLFEGHDQAVFFVEKRFKSTFSINHIY